MKQTLEEAAKDELLHSYSNRYNGNGSFEYGQQAMLNMFLKGAEWQENQSPWISVKDRLPEDSQEALILMRYIAPCTKAISYQIAQFTYLKAFGMEVFESRKEKVLAWMPIPSFDEILKDNRDVLNRIKEKGD